MLSNSDLAINLFYGLYEVRDEFSLSAMDTILMLTDATLIPISGALLAPLGDLRPLLLLLISP